MLLFWEQLLLRWLRRQRGGEMLAVPAGKVTLENGRKVRVRAFLLDATPVTCAEYTLFMRATGAERPPWMHRPGFGEPEHPVVGITYEQAAAYARWAGKRLPTEREWVRAARGDDSRIYPWGDHEPDFARAHYRRGATGGPAHVIGARERPGGVGPFGHVDMVGNVWEWCRGCVLRGGFWGSHTVPIDSRLIDRPDRISGGFGFRCAR